MTKKEAKEWWGSLPKIEKVGRVIVGGAVLLYGGILGFDRIYQAPARLDAVEVRVGALEGAVEEIRLDRPLLEFVACGQENRIRGIPEAECLRYLTGLR